MPTYFSNCKILWQAHCYLQGHLGSDFKVPITVHMITIFIYYISEYNISIYSTDLNFLDFNDIYFFVSLPFVPAFFEAHSYYGSTIPLSLSLYIYMATVVF